MGIAQNRPLIGFRWKPFSDDAIHIESQKEGIKRKVSHLVNWSISRKGNGTRLLGGKDGYHYIEGELCPTWLSSISRDTITKSKYALAMQAVDLMLEFNDRFESCEAWIDTGKVTRVYRYSRYPQGGLVIIDVDDYEGANLV